MSPEDFVAKWSAEAQAMHQRGALVNGAALLGEILQDFQAATGEYWDQPLTLADASHESGYSVDHLGLLIRQGTLPNAGRPHAPRIRRRELPRKPSRLPWRDPRVKLVGATPGQIARAVVTSDLEK
jgi:hypothetical protein